MVIRYKKNKGKGAGIRSAFEWARKAGCMSLVLLDGDGQHEPADIPNRFDGLGVGHNTLGLSRMIQKLSIYLAHEYNPEVPQ